MADADFSVKAIISAQTSQFEKGIKNAQSSINSMSKSIEGVQKLLKTAFSMVGITVGIKAVTDFGKSCVQSATQAQKAFNILDNTVKATGADAWTSTKEMDQLAKSLSDSTNYAVTEIESMQSVLLGFRNITGETFEDASEAIMDMATVMGMDLKSATQVVGKALDDPIKGLDSLRRQGFQFTEEQKAELTQLVRNGKQLQAQKIILNELANSYGGAAKAGQDSFAKQRHAIENFKDTLGGKLIPVMQVFAENSAKTLNNLTNLISKMDFTPVVNVITNLNKIFSSAFENISNYLKNVKNEVTDFISRFNFKPIVSILDTLIGVIAGVINKFKEVNAQKLEIFDKIKEAIISFSNSELFQKITEFINKIIDGIFFLWSEIQDISMEIRNLIVNKVIEIWNKIKELFENSQNALANSGQDIASWGDLFWSVLDNVFRIFQDLINGVKAILHGDWAVAWEYAKLAVMRVADSILKIISTIANAFPELINGMINSLNKLIGEINKIREFFGQDPLGLIEAFESVDLSKKTGLADKIKETEDKIQELTGHAADTAIKDLDGVSTKFAGFTSSALGYIQDLTNGIEKETEKQKTYFTGATSDGESSYKKFSEWDSKLLKQRQNNLSEYSKQYHEINIELIEQERKKALENEENEEERAKINKYYNQEIENEDDRFEKAKRERARETFHIIMGYMKTFLKDTIAGFKKVIDTFKNVLSTIGNFVKNTFDKLKNIFSTLFEFNIDDALNNLLKIEDAILTFFVETLPNLPSFFESAFSSVLVLIQTLINSIDWNKIKEFLTSIINTFVNYAPQIVSGIVEIFTNLVSTISNVLVENAPEIVDAFGQMFFAIIEDLPSIISNLIKVLGTYLSQIGRYIADNFDRISEDLSNIIESFVNGIAEFISSGGWKNLLDGLLAIQKAIEKAVTDNIDSIVDTIIDALPDLVDMLIESIVSASKTLSKLIKPIIKLILAIISALIDILTSDEVMDASLDAVMALIEAIFDELLPGIIKLIPKLIVKVIAQIVKNLPKIVKSIVEGLINAFTKTNWLQVVKDIFIGFIDAFKDLFGIHSPSTLFESFGINMVEGLVNGLKGMAEAVNTILQPVYNLFSNVFSGIGNNITNIFNGLLSNITNIFNNIGDVINNLVNTSLTWLSNSLSNLVNISFQGLVNIINSSTDGFANITNSVANLINSVAGLVEQINKLSGSLGGIPSIPGLPGFGGSGGGGSDDEEYTAGDAAIDVLTGGGYSAFKKLKKFLGFATGTNNAPAGLSVVGEAGPELVRFRGGEQVLNAHNTQKALEGMGGNTNNFNVTFNNLQDTSAFAMMNQLKQYNRQMAINGVI